jgi:hypothetical protein
VAVAAPLVGVWAVIAVGLARFAVPRWAAVALGFGGGTLVAGCVALLFGV